MKQSINSLEVKLETTDKSATQELMTQIDNEKPEYFVNLLSTNLFEKAKQLANEKNMNLDQILTKLTEKFQQLNVALKNKDYGQILVNNLKSHQNTLEIDDSEKSSITQNDIESIIDSQENLIYIIYPKLMKNDFS